MELHQPLEAVVAVDHPAIQVIQVGGGKAATIQLNHGANIRGDDGQHVHNHPAGLVAGLPEGFNHLQALDNAQLLLGGSGFQLGTQLLRELIQVNLLQQLLDSLGTHAGLKVVLILFPHIPVFLFGQHLVHAQRRIAGVGDDIGGKVQNLFQHLGADVQNQTHPGGNALEVPDVAARSSQLNVTHALPAHLGLGNFHAAAVTNLALILNLLIFTAVALPVLLRSENTLAVKAVPLRFQSTVVNGLRLLDFAVRPLPDHLRRSDANLNGIKGGICHKCASLVVQCLGVAIFHIAEHVTKIIGFLFVKHKAGIQHLVGIACDDLAAVIGGIDNIVIVILILQLNLIAVFIQHADVQAQCLQLLDQNLEGFGHTGLGNVCTLDNGLVGLDTTVRISCRV